MLEADWATQLGAVTLTWQPCTGIDVDGAPQYSTSAGSAPAIVQQDRRLIPGPQGQVEQVKAVAYVFSTSATITVQDKLYLPGSTVETPRILGVDLVNDDDGGQHHLEVLLA